MQRNELLEYVRNDTGLSLLLAALENRWKENPPDPAHAMDHVLRVALATCQLAQGRVPMRNCVAAALLHDIVSYPKDSPLRAESSTHSAEFARKILAEAGFDAIDVASIAGAVRTHSFSGGLEPQDFLGMCLQDADRLEALGAIGIYRVFATGAKMGASLCDPLDPWAKKKRELDDKRYSVDHFFTKLLKLPETMRTAEGKQEASRRAKIMKEYLRQLGHELGVPLDLA
jgi:uncharacterized protein